MVYIFNNKFKTKHVIDSLKTLTDLILFKKNEVGSDMPSIGVDTVEDKKKKTGLLTKNLNSTLNLTKSY